MKKLNNKGFAISVILYSIITLLIMILLLALGIMSGYRKNEKDLITDIKNNLNNNVKKVYTYYYDSATPYYTFSVSEAGYYRVELWGASGGNKAGYYGGSGAYTRGVIQLKSTDKLYVYVGSAGVEYDPFTGNATIASQGGYNGGGGVGSEYYHGSAGGGATDIRLTAGTWNNSASLASRIMVAGGGGGANNRNASDSGCGYGAGNGGSGGALNGFDGGNDPAARTVNGCSYGSGYGGGASQSSGGYTYSVAPSSYSPILSGSFGVGGTGQSGGGGGYFGGASCGHGGGGGGSSYISGMDGVMSVTSSSNLAVTSNTVHYSGFKFLDPHMATGVNVGNGKAVITYLGSDYVSGSTTELYDVIASGATLDTSINFNDKPTASSSSGLFIRSGTENNTNPIYYYRGVVSNNNVKFANFCWKIVRTTETGGIKLIYNGVPAADGSCNNTGTASQLASKSVFNSSRNDNTYVGYMYGTAGASTYAATHANTNNSIIKTAIDTWYASNMIAYTSKLEDTIWCNDRSLSNTSSGTGIGTSATTYYAAYERLWNSNPQPSLSCTNTNDRFTVNTANGNGALTYPVGLLTADEATMAGSGYKVYSSSSYLYTGQFWWLASPFVFDGICVGDDNVGFCGNLSGGYIDDGFAVEFFVDDIASLNYLIVDNGSYGIRPSVSLKPGTVVTGSGDGSVTNPYVIS